LRDVLARLTGRSTELLSYDEVVRRLKATGSAERGLQEIPLDAIAGSVGRPNDFTRDFLPRNDSDENRWARVDIKSVSLLPNVLAKHAARDGCQFLHKDNEPAAGHVDTGMQSGSR
jgi:hypothetical protein